MTGRTQGEQELRKAPGRGLSPISDPKGNVALLTQLQLSPRGKPRTLARAILVSAPYCPRGPKYTMSYQSRVLDT